MKLRVLLLLVLLGAGLITAAACNDEATLGPGVFCVDESGCAANTGFTRCDPFQRQCVPDDASVAARCETHADCLDPATPVCDEVYHACRGCRGPAEDTACGTHDAKLDRCQKDTGRCGACRPESATTDCPAPTTPICQQGTCRACRGHGECASGICRDDGSCAPESDIAYVDNRGVACVAGNHAGTRADPYCEIIDAMVAIGMRHTILVAGSKVAYRGISTLGATVPIHIVGPGRSAPVPATISNPGSPCVDVYRDTEIELEGMELSTCKGGVTSTQATVTVRRCDIHDIDGLAVELRLSSRPHVLDGNVIRDSGGGVGLYAVTGFDVRNNFIAHNVGDVGGVYFDTFSNGRFEFNTVRDNSSMSYAGGVECALPAGGTKVALSASILVDNTKNADGHQFSSSCLPMDVVAGSKEPPVAGVRSLDPDFQGPDYGYRLKPPPFNKDVVDAVQRGDNDHDIDSAPRASGPAADIGCFEVPQ